MTRPDWGTCTPVRFGKWRRYKSDGHAYSYGSAVKFSSVLGIDLSISRQYSKSQQAIYMVRGPRQKKMCGNDGIYPSESGKQIERFR